MATGDTPTTNYGWLKPPPHDAPLTWGVSLNADLDSIDATVHALSLEVDTLNQGKITANKVVLSKPNVVGDNLVIGQLNGVNRWAIDLGDQVTESGGNHGSNFAIDRYSDAGAYLDTPLYIDRSSGAVSLSGTLSCHYFSSWSQVVLPANTSDNSIVQFGNSAGAGRGYVGWLRSNDSIYLNSNSGGSVIVGPGGVILNGATTVNGAVALNGNLNVNGSASLSGSVQGNYLNSTGNIDALSGTVSASFIHSTGNVTADANVTAGLGVYGQTFEASQGSIRIKRGSNSNASLLLNNNATDLGYISYDMSAGKMIMSHVTTGAALALDSSSNFTFSGSGNAYKAGGGSWAATSDARVKEVEVDYEAGLDEILRLRPVVYRYKGNDSYVADATSPHKEVAEAGTAFVGLVAQEAELAMPEIVSMREGYIDGEKVADLRQIDQSPLIFALINAVKELKAEIEELKRR